MFKKHKRVAVRNPFIRLDFARIVRQIYRECYKGNDDREVREHYCDVCKNIEHHIYVSEKDGAEKYDPTGLVCISCCAISESFVRN